MKSIQKKLAVLAATGVAATALFASPTLVCGLTAKQLQKCCCEQTDGKLVCKETGQVLDKCCCTR